MKNLSPISILALLLFVMFAQSACTSIEKNPIFDKSDQLLVILTPDWDNVQGVMYLFDREGDSWKEADKITIVVGKKGMAWGRGEDVKFTQEGAVKVEGDKKSPAGIFNLETAFGYLQPDSIKGLKFPYVHVDSLTRCIEDGESKHYNRIVNESETKADWEGADHMLRNDNLYEWGVFVSHNLPNTAAGSGSCIFLHAWRGPDSGTAGCTAMDIKKVKELVFWLDASKKPLMVQMPKAYYKDFGKVNGLPELN